MFNTGKELLELTNKYDCSISDILIKKANYTKNLYSNNLKKE